MHAYFMKYRFTHPTKEDFLKTIEEVSGREFALVLRSGDLWLAGDGLQSVEDRVLPGELVRR